MRYDSVHIYRIYCSDNLGEDGGTEGQTERIADGAQHKSNHELWDGDPRYVGTPLVSAPGVRVLAAEEVFSNQIK